MVKTIGNSNWVEDYARFLNVNIQERESSSLKDCKNLNTLCENRVSVTKLCAKPQKGVKI